MTKLSHVVEVAGGGDMAYALERNGTVWAWGYGAYGQLGDDHVVSLDTPTRVASIP